MQNMMKVLNSNNVNVFTQLLLLFHDITLQQMLQ